MSVAAHRAHAPKSVACMVLTISDSRTIGTDTGGDAIVRLLDAAGHVVVRRRLVRDEPDEVVGAIRDAIASDDVRAVITTGGTGFSPRDRTIEAVTSLFDRRIDGFGELFRMLSFEAIGPAAMLSRATAGVAGRAAIFSLPGSPAAVTLAMERLILPELGHLTGELAK